MSKTKRILVVGATGGSGRATVERLLAAGHQVTAFARTANAWSTGRAGLVPFVGDATNAEDLDRAMPGHDAVVVTLGIRENPLRVRLRGAAHTATDVRSLGTRRVAEAMQRHGVRRLVVQSTYGVGETRDRLRWIDRLFFRALLKPQIDDTEVQERIVRDTDLEWVLAQPVHLTDDEDSTQPFTSTTGEVQEWSVSRNRVATFLTEAVSAPDYVGRSVALSG